MKVSELYEELKQDLCRFTRTISRNEQEANDLIQDAIEKSLRCTELLDWPRHKQKAWFYRVMKNQLIDIRRKEKRETDWDDSVIPPFTTAGTSYVEMVDLLSKLPASLSDLVFKHFWLGLTSQEISEKVGVPASTVRYRIRLAVKKLREYMKEEG
ncbi:RNA polymerase sigma factor [Halalkalibacterium halodurans]|uniref:RNA polymerase n=1 Tax=Halalkalibacterium halodurans TaxID=86665 RepID=A0A0M0KG89_ALKHA|nr:RNA polymerase sigma factor [Halalkalibacterium halodurans]TPE67285.1 RNA polymerase sigma factor [Halalkalibacterium halodurans]